MLLRVQQEDLPYLVRQAEKRQIQAYAIALAMLENSEGPSLVRSLRSAQKTK